MKIQTLGVGLTIDIKNAQSMISALERKLLNKSISVDHSDKCLTDLQELVKAFNLLLKAAELGDAESFEKSVMSLSDTAEEVLSKNNTKTLEDTSSV